MRGRSPPASLGRRRYLEALSTLSVVGIAGCAGDVPESEGGSTAESDVERTSNAGPTDSTSTDKAGTITTDDLDLREANVVGVEVEPVDGSYRFSVTLYHDDDGEDGYADWWQVETVQGDVLGRRELLHAHGTTPFTRSETIDVPDGIDCVVVRGHDQTHGYGGQAVLVNVETGATRAVRQGADRRQVDPGYCP